MEKVKRTSTPALFCTSSSLRQFILEQYTKNFRWNLQGCTNLLKEYSTAQGRKQMRVLALFKRIWGLKEKPNLVQQSKRVFSKGRINMMTFAPHQPCYQQNLICAKSKTLFQERNYRCRSRVCCYNFTTRERKGIRNLKDLARGEGGGGLVENAEPWECEFDD